MRARLLATIVLGMGLTGPAAAHHGLANFDLNTDLEIRGVVTEIAFINPHSWLYVDVTEPDGAVTAWQCELRGASVLKRSGWTPEMFEPGAEVIVTGAPDRFTPNTCYLGTVQFADGTSIDRYGQIAEPVPAPVERPARLPSGVPNLTGDWAGEQRVLTDPRGISGAFLPISIAERLDPGAVPQGTTAFPGTRGTAVSLAEDPIDAFWNQPSAMPLTEAGAEAIAGFDAASTDNPRLRCETTNILFDWTFETDINRIEQQEDLVRLLYGTMGLERIIHLDGREHPADLVPSRAGHSIGQWEEDVLVVDTVGFEPGILSADGHIPHSDQLHVVERFTLDPETHALTRRYVAVDPLYFEGEFAGMDVVYPSDLPYQGAECDDRSFKAEVDDEPVRPASRWPRGTVPSLVVAIVLAGIAFALARRTTPGTGRS